MIITVTDQKIYTPKEKVITDLDGNVYTSVIIGNREWLVENWKCRTYSDGTEIPFLTDNTAWSSNSDGACCVYNNDSAYEDAYGLLYSWDTINDNVGYWKSMLSYILRGGTRESGWRVPTLTDWTVLRDYLGGAVPAGDALKSNSYWSTPGDYNSSGYSALPGGYRLSTGVFSSITADAYFWSSAMHWPTTYAWGFRIKDTPSNADIYNNLRKTGMSIRMVKNV